MVHFCQTPMHEAPAAADLIERAFGLARQSGKPDWWAMTIPVLKNRLLLLTKNTFKEADFGATSFRDFLSKISDVVKVEETPPPGFVILKSAASERSERPAATVFRGERIRADLWRAVLDYASGLRYVWDISQQNARPAKVDEDGLVLPTVSAADLDEWRAEFVALHKPPNTEVAKLVEGWREKRLPTAGLPAAVRPVWNSYLKRKVEQRLKHWFESSSIKAPAIMEERPGSGASEKQVEALRDFIIGCVRTMSKQELLELRISPATAMRALRPQNSSDENER
jgi:hypothetical protein